MHELVARRAGIEGLLQRIEGPESVRSELDTRQPTMCRAKTSMTKAT